LREPFISGTDTLERLAHLARADHGFLTVFPASYFPDAQIVLEWLREEGGGNVYGWAEKEMEGWLCPALLRYFEQASAKLHVQVKAAG
jgi:hypothetical protein